VYQDRRNRSSASRAFERLVHLVHLVHHQKHLLVTNEFSDRVYDLRDGDTKTVRNLLAYRKVGVEGCTATVFDKEFVSGVNKAELVKELQRLGWVAPAAYDGNPAIKRRFNGKQIRVLVFLPPSLQNSDFGGASPASLAETLAGKEVSPEPSEAP
jgi:putative DNA primase/helicase